MLVLTRKSGQAICIGDGVCVTVLEVRGGRVRLAVTAPAEVPVWRDELQPRLAATIDNRCVIRHNDGQTVRA
jgi:carbon storage regulator